MMARNEQKMKGKLEVLEKRFPKITTRAVVCDFSDVCVIADYRKIVEEQLSDIDIGVVCLNAGIATEGPVALISDQELENEIRVNGLHPVYLGKVLLETLMNRKQRSALIVTASIMSFMVNPGGCAYSSTKAFVSNFWQGVHFEAKDKVDVLVWTCGGVRTKIFADSIGAEGAAKL